MPSQPNPDESSQIKDLCETCGSMFASVASLRALHSPRGYKHLSIVELERSQKGCPCCVIILSELGGWADSRAQPLYLGVDYRGLYPRTDGTGDGGEYPFGILDAKDIEIVCRKLRDGDSFSYPGLCAYKPHSKLYTAYFKIVLTLILYLDDIASQILSCPKLDYNIYDMCNDSVVRHAKVLLSKCYSLHERCPPQKSHELPARVIDVGFEDGSKSPRLYIPDRCEQAPYIALSYCWGGPQTFTTGALTIQERINGISMTELPQSIQDSIKITRKLGFRYLWVDALCIIQDNADDKHAQIQKMGEIYKHATLTIAATNSDNVYGGFLKARSFEKACMLPFRLSSGSLGKIGIVESRWKGGPLFKRAWTLQEYLLSPRLLVYGQGQVYWQCQSEDLRSLGIRNTSALLQLKRLPAGVFDTSLRGLHESRQETIWSSLVQNYSGRACTFPEDRMVALAGIARELGDYFGDFYLAGMWGKCLVELLGWFRKTDPSNSDQMGGLSSVPSWSWLSVNGPVCMPTFELTLDAEVISCKIHRVNKNEEFGHILGGTLILRGKIIHSSEVPSTASEAFHKMMDHIQSDSFESPETDYWYFRLAKQFVYNDTGLILVHTPGTGDGLFKRIGRFFVYKRAGDLWAGAEYKAITII